jgi:hypothetical protein
MNHQKGFIEIPSWFFWMVPIGIILSIVEIVRIVVWLYHNVSITFK